jgi:hypothetical protein
MYAKREFFDTSNEQTYQVGSGTSPGAWADFTACSLRSERFAGVMADESWFVPVAAWLRQIHEASLSREVEDA